MCHAITLSWNIWPQIMLIFSIDSVSFVSFVSGCVLILTLILGHWYWGHWWRLILTWSRHTAGAREGYIQPTKGKQQPWWSENNWKKKHLSFLKIISTFENTKTKKCSYFQGWPWILKAISVQTRKSNQAAPPPFSNKHFNPIPFCIYHRFTPFTK